MKFLDALTEAKKLNKNIVIPDIKCFSPKEGDLMQGRDPISYAKQLCSAGAPVLSVVTEEKEFHGSLKMLADIAAAVDLPILRKDFIHTKEGLVATKEAGASAILLMCSCLEKEELKTLYSQALELGLDPFVETHKAEDFEIVKQLGAKLVGINNRDILELEKDDGNVSHTVQLSSLAPEDAFLVTESSIENADQVRTAIEASADAALVGTAILKAENTESFYEMLCRKVSLKICGIMNSEDAKLCVSMGVDRIGFVAEYPVNVPWNLDRKQAGIVRNAIPCGFKSAMICGGTAEHVLDIAETIHPDMCQLHYRFSREDYETIIPRLHEMGIAAIAKFPVGSTEQMKQFGICGDEEVIKIFEELGADELIIDPRNQDNPSKEGQFADLESFNSIKSKTSLPLILAGGITVDNIKEQLAVTGAFCVDLMSGSEFEPGRKDPKKILGLIENIQ